MEKNEIEGIFRSRIKIAFQQYDYSVYKLTSNETDRARINKQINRESTISAETLYIILEAFPNISAEWLMRGDGPMLKSEAHQKELHQHVHAEGGTANVSGTGNVEVNKKSEIPTEIPDHALLQRIFKMQQDAISQRDKTIAAQELLIEQLRASK